jgi:hypothetical protein
MPALLRIISHTGGRGDRNAEDEELAVDAPVSPRAVLPREAQYEQSD